MNRVQTVTNQRDTDLQSDEEDVGILEMSSFRLFMRGLRRAFLAFVVAPSQMLMKEAEEKCRNPTVVKWLRDNSWSKDFSNLEVIFNFLKEKIEVEEKKDHSNTVDITFIAHGAIRDVMIPACCLLPLPSITDVVLYAPWNSLSCGLGYAMATGRLKPHHRVFVSKTDSSREIPAPDKLPNHWNSMKEAGEQKIPNITVSPLRSDDGVWEYYQDLQKKHGPPGRNRIMIPFIFPESIGSVPFSVVSLALSLVLDSSRFTATVHLSCCLGDQSRGQKFDLEYLRSQYAYASDNVIMKVSDNAYTESWPHLVRRWVG
ncbi:uncharacterized protein LOC115386609 [Salarias fasciatus]|uniref:uncharacterized protein LOC115386609 n=1 Tax=Salarias fasciatus TaxID=181472 RepID=UPI001176F937|nr:uncharacterized protein LOC115386609 [Salarias fasciatus]XP_029944867.1 uncharacterized protein LOC115386609 [Salarias fasciatus]XP_029944868.1 uncharacterized protein LOC115386609 [Salarias fasciatus]